MSKSSGSIVRAAEAAGVTVDEYMEAMADVRRQEAEALAWGISDAALDRLDAPDGPLAGFECHADEGVWRA